MVGSQTIYQRYGINMAIKQTCYVSLSVVGDGTSTSETANFNTSPFVYGGIGSIGSPQTFSTGFLSLSTLPCSITITSSTDGQTISTSIGLLGAVTFTWPTAIPNGTVVTWSGYVEF